MTRQALLDLAARPRSITFYSVGEVLRYREKQRRLRTLTQEIEHD